MARTDPQANLRIPADLKERLEEAAQAGRRSLNAEIVARLQGSFETRTVKIDLTVDEDATVRDIQRVLEQLKPGIPADQPIEVTLTTIKKVAR